MAKFFAVLIALCLATEVLGRGKEPLHPHVPAIVPPTTVQKAAVDSKTVHTCYAGYELSADGFCVKPISEPAKLVCTNGSLVNDGCEVEVPYLSECPLGYIPEDGACTKTTEVGAQFYCPKGFFDDGVTCAQSVPSESAVQCDVGELVGDRCIATERSEHLISAQCPDGSEVEEDGNCWKVIDTFDCTNPVPPEQHVVAQPKGHTPLGKKVMVTKGKHLRMLFGKEQPIPTPSPLPPKRPLDVGCPKEMIAVSTPHATKVGVATQICTKKIQVDALTIVSCPPGFLDNGDFCTKETVSPATMVCLSGQAKDGACAPTLRRVPKYAGCPKDAFSARGKCWLVDTVDAKLICAKGFTDTGSSCVGVVDSPGLECPADLELVGDRCVGQLVRPPVSLLLEPEEGCTNKY